MPVLHRDRYSMRESDPMCCFWFFEAYYRSFGKQISIISRKVYAREGGCRRRAHVLHCRHVNLFYWDCSSNNVYLLLISANFNNIWIFCPDFDNMNRLQILWSHWHGNLCLIYSNHFFAVLQRQVEAPPGDEGRGGETPPTSPRRSVGEGGGEGACHGGVPRWWF